jgi:hypothetical protein
VVGDTFNRTKKCTTPKRRLNHKIKIKYQTKPLIDRIDTLDYSSLLIEGWGEGAVAVYLLNVFYPRLEPRPLLEH